MTTPKVLENSPDWTAEEKPTLPGSPANIKHSRPIEMAYFVVGILVTFAGDLGNGLVSANMPQFQGESGLTSSQLAWLPAAYVIGSSS
jgi:hypothetical protein